MEKLRKEIQSVVDIFTSGNLSKAEILTKELMNDNPKIVFLYNLLGLIYEAQEKRDEAIKCYEQGISIDPNYGMIYNNLGLLFFKDKTDNSIERAKDFYNKSISLDKRIPEPHNNLGNLYDYVGKTPEAINCYKRALEINPNFSYAHHNLGSAYVAIGKFNEAKKHFIKSIKINPDFASTHRSLSRITKYTNDDEHFLELKKIYKSVDSKDSEKKIELGFALGKAYEDTKNFDQSFFHYKEANFLQRKKINFSLKKEVEKFDDVKKVYNKDLIDKYNNCGFNESSPIFIIGMPRSSTTLVEQILCSHPSVYGAEEVDLIPKLIKKNFGDKNLRLFFENIVDFSKDDLRKIGEEYINKMNIISNKSDRSTDKLPINFLHIGFIKLILPESKIIHCHRNPRDNCFSIYKNQFSSGMVEFAYDLNEIVKYYNLYNDIMKYWINLLPSFIYNIKYENLISDTKEQVKNLLNHCDLNWSDDCLTFYNNMRPVKSASDVQVRSKIYNSSIESWKNYDKYLNEYFEKLEN